VRIRKPGRLVLQSAVSYARPINLNNSTNKAEAAGATSVPFRQPALALVAFTDV
jgi:hypothetical protein